MARVSETERRNAGKNYRQYQDSTKIGGERIRLSDAPQRKQGTSKPSFNGQVQASIKEGIQRANLPVKQQMKHAADRRRVYPEHYNGAQVPKWFQGKHTSQRAREKALSTAEGIGKSRQRDDTAIHANNERQYQNALAECRQFTGFTRTAAEEFIKGLFGR